MNRRFHLFIKNKNVYVKIINDTVKLTGFYDSNNNKYYFARNIKITS